MALSIQFVDDDPMVLAAMRRQLVRKLPTCKLAFFRDAPSALKAAEQHVPDIVFSDIRMPDLDGVKFLEIVRKRYPSCRCFVLTGQADDADMVRVSQLAERVFEKPIDIDLVRSVF